MNDLVTTLALQLKNDHFNRGLRSSTNDVGQFSRQSRAQIRALKKEFNNITNRFAGDLKRELTGIIGLWAILGQSKRSGQLDKDLTRMAQTAGVARDETKALREELFLLQRQTGVTVENSRKGMDTLIAGGLNWGQAREAMKTSVRGEAVSHVDAEILAGALKIGATHFGANLAQPGVADGLLDKMVIAGGVGNAELEGLSNVFARIGPNARQAGFSFEKTLGFAEQLSEFDANPERLSTLADSTLRIFTNQKYADNVTKMLGVSFFDRAGKRRDPYNVLQDIATRYQKQKTDQQRSAFIADVFGETDLDTQRGMKVFLEPGKIDAMRKKTATITAATGEVARRLPDAIDNSIDQVSRLKGALSQAADSFIQPFNSGLDASIKKLLDSKEQGGWGLSGNEMLFGAGGIALATAGAYKFGGPLMKKLTGRFGSLAGGLATGQALQAATGVPSVYVVNMPSSFGGSGYSGGYGGGSHSPKNKSGTPPKNSHLSGALPKNAPVPKASWASRLGRAGHYLGKRIPYAGLLMGGVELADIATSDMPPQDKLTGVAGVAGGMGGAALGGWGGAAAGAVMGSIVPGIGTAIGAVVGGIFGSIGGYSLGESSAEAIAKSVQQHQPPQIDYAHLRNVMGSQTGGVQKAANAELKVVVEDNRTRIHSTTATGIDVDIAGGYMVTP